MPLALLKQFAHWISPTTVGHSMTRRAGLAVAFIFCTILTASTYSFYLANTAEKDAQAINDAGSIRMATYRINHELALSANPNSPHTPNPILADDMTARLDKLSLYQAKNSNKHGDIDKALTKIRHDWEHTLLPNLEQSDSTAFYQHSLVFLDDVNHLVDAIGKRNEYRQEHQQHVQIISLLLITFVMLVGMWELHRNALAPLKNLTATARHFRQGKSLDMQAGKMDIKGYQELNELSDAFFSKTTKPSLKPKSNAKHTISPKATRLYTACTILLRKSPPRTISTPKSFMNSFKISPAYCPTRSCRCAFMGKILKIMSS